MPKAIVTIATFTPSGTNITGLVDYTNLDFSEDVQVFRGGVSLITGIVAGGEVDVIPGTTSTSGDIELTGNQPDLDAGEDIEMRVIVVTRASITYPSYDPASETFTCYVSAERSGQSVINPTSASLNFYGPGPNTLLQTFPSNGSPNARGVFTFIGTGLVLTAGTYFMEATVVVDGANVKANRAFNLIE